MDKIKNMLSGRKFTYYATTSLMIVAVIGILFIINLIVNVDTIDRVVDMTVDQRFSISDQTKEYLKNIKKDVKIISFSSTSSPEMEYVKKVVDEYKRTSGKITFSTFDADSNPQLARKYNIQSDSLGFLIVECGDKNRKINVDQVASDLQSGTMKLEGQLTGAINYVIEGREVNAYFLSGHGEITIDSFSSIKDRMNTAGINNKDLDLTTVPQVPADASAIAIVGPKTDLSDEEKAKVQKYLDNNGKLLLLLNSAPEIATSKMKNISELLKAYNIKADDDIIIETSMSNLFVNYPVYFKPNLRAHEVTNSVMSSQLRFAFAESRSLSILNDPKVSVTPEILGVTSDKSWGETNFTDNNPSRGADDKAGPVDVMVLAEKNSADPKATDKSRIIVYGNATNVMDKFIKQFSAEGNAEVFVNSMKWLTDYKDTINIPQKTLKIESVSPDGSQFWTMVIIALLLPLLFIIGGVIVWMVRKRL